MEFRIKREICDKLDNYYEGIYTNPFGCDNIGQVFYRRVETGGYSGGSCWDDSEPTHYSRDYEEGLPIFDKFIEEYVEDIKFSHYNYLKNLMQNSNDSEYEYYGNSTEYKIYSIETKKVINFLIKKGYNIEDIIENDKNRRKNI